MAMVLLDQKVLGAIVTLFTLVQGRTGGFLACPTVDLNQVGTCDQKCKNDFDCQDPTLKCCSNGCGQTCQTAVKSGGQTCSVDFCQLTPFSPCPFDNEGTFSDDFLRMCFKDDGNQTQSTKAKENFKILKNADVLDLTKLTCKPTMVIASRLSRALSTEVQDWIAALTSGVDIAKIKKIPTDVFRLFKSALVTNLIERMNSDQKACMCKYILNTDGVTKADLKPKVCDSSKDKLCAANGDTTANICPFGAKRVSELCVDAKPTSQWTNDDLSKTMNDDDRFKSLCKKPETTIDQIPENVIVQSADSLSAKCKAMKDKTCQGYFKKKVKKIISKSTFAGEKSKLMKMMCACGGSSRDVESLQLTDSEFLENFCDIAEKNLKEKRKIKGMLTNVSTFTKSEINRYLPYIAEDKRKVEELDGTTLLESLKDISPNHLKGRAAKNVFDIVKKSSQFQDFTKYTEVEVEKLGPALMAVLDKKDILEIPAESLGKAIQNKKLTEAEFLKGADDAVINKYKEYANGCLTATDVESLGNLVASLKPEDFDCMSSTEIKNLMESQEFTERLLLIGSKLKTETRKTIAKKVKKEAGGIEILMKHGTFKDDVGELDDSKLTDIVTKIRSGEKVDITCSKTKCKKLLDAFGPLKTLDRETLENIEGSDVLSAISAEDIDDDTVDLIPYLPQSGVKEKASKKFGDLIENWLVNASADEISRRKDVVKRAPKILLRLSKNSLQRFGHCMEIKDGMKNDDLSSIPSYYLNDKFEYLLDCLGVSSTSAIDKTVLDEAGNLLCTMPESYYSRLTAEALEEFNQQLAGCPFQNLEKITKRNKALRDKGSIPTDSSSITGDHLAILGAGVSTQEKSVIQNIPDALIAEQMPDLLDAINERDEINRKRSNKGLKDDNSASDEKETNERKSEFSKKTVTSLLNTKSSSGRRRRNVQSLSCNDIKELGSAITGITVNQISGIQNDEFKECVGVLGGVTDFTQGITIALAQKAKSAYGDVTNWTTKVIDQLGRILKGLDPSDLQKIQFNHGDIVRCGTYHGWSQRQLAVLFSKFLTLEGKDLSAVSDSTLSELGNILCGASPNQIALINADAYRRSAENVGKVTNCSQKTLNALANKAKETYGSDVTQWSSLTISEIGIVLGGLGSDIASLSETQIEAIDDVHFMNMPSTAIAQFELSQLDYFSSVQAQASIQQSCPLPNDKRAKILLVSGLTNDPCQDRTTTSSTSSSSTAQDSTTVPLTDQSSSPRKKDSTTVPKSSPRSKDSTTTSNDGLTSLRPKGSTTVPRNVPPSSSRAIGTSTIPSNRISSFQSQISDRVTSASTSRRTLTTQSTGTCPVSECPLECQRSARFCSRMFDNNNALLDSAVSEIISFTSNNVLRQKAKDNFDILKPLLAESKLTCDGMFELIRLLTRMNSNEVRDIESQDTGQTVDINKLMRIHPVIMKMLKTSVLSRFIQKLSSNTDKSCFCKRSYELDCITRTTIKAGSCGVLDCSESDLTSNGLCSVSKGAAKDVKRKCFEDKTAVKSPREWTSSDFKNYLTDPEAAEVLAEKANALDNIDEDAILTKESIVKRTCSNTTSHVKDKFKQAALRLGETASDNSAQNSLIEVAKVCGAGPNDLNFGSDTQKLSVFDDSQVNNPEEKRKIKTIFDSKYSDISQLDVDEAARFSSLYVEDEEKVEQLPNNIFIEALNNITKKNISLQGAQNVLKKFRTTTQFSTISAISGNDVKALGCALKAFKKSEVKEIQDSAIAGPLFNGELTDVDWDTAVAPEIFEKGKRDRSLSNADITADNLEKFGSSLVLKIGPANLREIPSNAIKSWLEKDSVAQKVKETIDDIDASTIRVLREKTSSQSGGKNVLLNLGGEFAKSVTLDDSDRQQVATDLQNGQRIDKTFSKSEGQKVLKKFNNPATLSTEDFENLETSNLLGMIQPSDARNIFETDFTKGLDFLKSLGKSNSEPSEKLNEDCTKIIKDKVDTATPEEISAIETSIQNNKQVILRLPIDTLRKMNDREALITKMKDSDISTIPCQKFKGKFRFFLETRNLLSANELTANDCEDAGILLCSATESEYKKLNVDAFKQCNSFYSKCPCRETSPDERKNIELEKFIPSSPDLFSEENITTLGADISTQPEEVIAGIPENVLKKQLQGALEISNEKDKVEKKRKKIGFQNDRSSSEKQQKQRRKHSFNEKVIRTIFNTRSSQQSGRRRRSTGTLTCDEMRSVQTALSALTVDQISAITTSDFNDCADILGQTNSFSAAQEEALAQKAIEAWGPTSTWNASNVDNAGRILQGLTVNDLNALTLTVDQIYAMGTYEDWEDTKKKTLFTNFLTLAGHTNPSTITGSQLQSLSHIVCGAETSQLAQITPANYGYAADSVGDLTSCSEQQLSELATLAKTYYGSNITSWTDATMTEIGIVIGGLPSTDISQLTESHIDAIESGDVYYIPPTTLSYFSPTQFGYFSSAQAQAVSEGQRNALSSDQISALETAAGISFSTTYSNCTTLSVSWMLMLTAVFLSLTNVN